MLVLEGARLIDGAGGDPLERVNVVVQQDRIQGVVAAAGSSRPRDPRAIDLAGLTLMPGLIDLHSHMGVIAPEDASSVDAAMLAARMFQNAELCLLSGHTTAREVAGADSGLKGVIETGLIPGPRLFPSGPLLSQTGGHGHGGPAYLPPHHHFSGIPGLSQLSLLCDGADGVRLATREAFRRGATQIKVALTGGILSGRKAIEGTQFTLEELKAAVAEAHARDTYVTGHAHTSRAIRLGLEAGLECFEHGSFLDEETAAEMAARRCALVPTLTMLHVTREKRRCVNDQDAELVWLEEAEEAMMNSIKIASDAGVQLGSGTDLVGPKQDRRGLEVALKARVLGPMAAIVSATKTNAEILRMGGELGTVEEGKIADLIALDGDPLADPTLFDQPDRVVLVIKAGRVMKDTREARVN